MGPAWRHKPSAQAIANSAVALRSGAWPCGPVALWRCGPAWPFGHAAVRIPSSTDSMVIVGIHPWCRRGAGKVQTRCG